MFNLAYLVVVFPIAAFMLIVLFLNRSHRASAWTAIAGIFGALVVAYGILLEALPHGEELLKHPFFAKFDWFPAGQSFFTMGWMLDPLAVVMLAMVTTTCLMIFIYSVGYMRHAHLDAHGHAHQTDDPRYSRFFAYISLFATGMLGLVISSNLLELFVFWEIMGLCSYLLIGFWSVRLPDEHHIDDAQVVRATDASKKAFLTTRIGDVIFFIGMIWLYVRVGTLDFDKIFTPESLKFIMTDVTAFGVPSAGIIALLILGGTIGKSAQFPLHVWLPDAMEGPTPVSALIHAATMVAAGVFLIARMFPLFATTTAAPAMGAVAIVGAFTALFAATIGLAQDDIKRVLAYSTISQLGYMVAALGIAAYAAGTFHLITHAFFKALLFLSAGSVIHGIGTNDMMQMGGLRKKMGITTIVFLIGAAALMGLPPFAGFWSKDEILATALERVMQGDWLSLFVYLCGTLAAFFTALYTGRQIFLTFFGAPRDEHAHEHVHESPAVMWAPLAILALFATFIGFIGSPMFGAPFQVFVAEEKPEFNFIAAGISVGVAVAGLGLAWVLYGMRPLKAGERDPLSRWLGPAWKVLRNKYYVDEIYAATIVRLTVLIATLCAAFDKWIVDGTVNVVGKLSALFGRLNRWLDETFVDGFVNQVGLFTDEVSGGLRAIQTGKVQNYLLFGLTGAALFAFVFFIR
ncbi:MAG: NADH-quinone oxidoreductase subunit L [Chloroflexi bacterium]|nr:NADH-quinone oxidoreductase subunit L [Chloroflexota bacterium]